MKNSLLVFAALLLYVSCKKDDDNAPDCQTCTVILVNAESYPYLVSFSGWGTGAPSSFTLSPVSTKTFTNMPSGKQITVKGDFQSPFAHNDFEEKVQCLANCGTVTVVLED